MTQKSSKRIRLLYGIVLSVSLAVTAVCLMVACVYIYRTGGEIPYSRQYVAQVFSNIAIPTYVCLALVVGSVVLHCLLPREEERLRAPSRPGSVLRRLRKRSNPATWDADTLAQVTRERKWQLLYRLTAGLVALAGGVVFLVYALDGSHYPDTVALVPQAMVQAMWWLIPCAAVPFGYGVFAVYAVRSSEQREIALLKTTDLSGKPAEPTKKPTGELPVIVVRCVLLAAGVALTVYGLLGGGIADVVGKAAQLCRECIGLG